MTAALATAPAFTGREETLAKRRALTAGSSRARVTTANARWTRCAEDRNRKVIAYEAALDSFYATSLGGARG